LGAAPPWVDEDAAPAVEAEVEVAVVNVEEPAGVVAEDSLDEVVEASSSLLEVGVAEPLDLLVVLLALFVSVAVAVAEAELGTALYVAQRSAQDET
jgi:hypothetical protein